MILSEQTSAWYSQPDPSPEGRASSNKRLVNIMPPHVDRIGTRAYISQQLVPVQGSYGNNSRRIFVSCLKPIDRCSPRACRADAIRCAHRYERRVGANTG